MKFPFRITTRKTFILFALLVFFVIVNGIATSSFWKKNNAASWSSANEIKFNQQTQIFPVPSNKHHNRTSHVNWCYLGASNTLGQSKTRTIDNIAFHIFFPTVEEFQKRISKQCGSETTHVVIVNLDDETLRSSSVSEFVEAATVQFQRSAIEIAGFAKFLSILHSGANPSAAHVRTNVHPTTVSPSDIPHPDCFAVRLDMIRTSIEMYHTATSEQHLVQCYSDLMDAVFGLPVSSILISEVGFASLLQKITYAISDLRKLLRQPQWSPSPSIALPSINLLHRRVTECISHIHTYSTTPMKETFLWKLFFDTLSQTEKENVYLHVDPRNKLDENVITHQHSIVELLPNIVSFRKMIDFERIKVHWFSLCCFCCGFAQEIVGLALPVLSNHYTVHLSGHEGCYCNGYPNRTEFLLKKVLQQNDFFDIAPVVTVAHTSPMHYTDCEVEGDYKVGRSMYELSPIPQKWLPKFDFVDEIWTPSDFVHQNFLDALQQAQIRKQLVMVPEAINVRSFSPRNPTTDMFEKFLSKANKWNATHIASNDADWKYHGAGQYKFLSVFKWEERKGWKTLFQAYSQAFMRDKTVSLYVVTHIFSSNKKYENSRDAKLVLQWAIEEMNAAITNPSGDVPHVVIITAPLQESELISIYHMCDSFVLPTHGEGWGLPVIQAMSIGMPTITTNYSGMLEFATPDTAYLIPVVGLRPLKVEDAINLVDYEPGQHFAVPSLKETVALMKVVFTQREESRKKGELARKHIFKYFSEEKIGNEVVLQFQRIDTFLNQRMKKHRLQWLTLFQKTLI